MVRRILLLLLVAGVGITAFFVYYHPPMRLMPPPLLFQMGGASIVDARPDLVENSRIDLFYATNRLPVGPRDNRVYTVAPDRQVHLGTATLRIGEEGSTLAQLRDWTLGSASGDRPFVNLERMTEAAVLQPGTLPQDAADWFADVAAAVEQSPGRDVIVYVHGANTTVERAAGQAAQLKHFSGREAVVILYAWPTAENFLRYPRDIETALGAAPHLAEFLKVLAERTGARRINVFTYSAGATIGSHALALLAQQAPQAAARIGDVYHAAPDADFRDFVADIGVYGGPAQRVTAAVNLGDSALRLAGVVNRASRAGRPDLRELDAAATDTLLAAARAGDLEVVQVSPDTLPDLAATSHTFWYDEPWVSSDVLVALLFGLGANARELASVAGPQETTIWTFPPDFPARMPALLDRLRASLAPAAATSP